MGKTLTGHSQHHHISVASWVMRLQCHNHRFCFPAQHHLPSTCPRRHLSALNIRRWMSFLPPVAYPFCPSAPPGLALLVRQECVAVTQDRGQIRPVAARSTLSPIHRPCLATHAILCNGRAVEHTSVSILGRWETTGHRVLLF
jgi:hypothetical protein